MGRTEHGVSRVLNFVWFSPNPRFCSQFHHRICRPDLSYTQAQRWKQAKTKTPAHHLTAIVKPARPQRGRRGRATPRKRWNDAVGTALAHGPGNKNEPPPHMAAIHRFSTPDGLRRVTRGPSMAVSHKGFPMGRGTRRPSTVGVTQRPSVDGPGQAMAEPADGGRRRRTHAMAAASPAGIK